jgi:hypothetical protein
VDRALAYEARGRGFESLYGRMKKGSYMEEFVSVTCPSCGVKVNFYPKLTGIEVNDKYRASASIGPHLRVILQTGNLIPHDCEDPNWQKIL